MIELNPDESYRLFSEELKMTKHTLLFLTVILPVLLFSCDYYNRHIDEDEDYLISYSDRELRLNQTLDSEIRTKGDINTYYISFIAGTKYRITLSSIQSFEPQLTLYRPGGNTIIEMKNTGTYTGTHDWWGYDRNRTYDPLEKESIVYTAETSGTYYIRVKDIYDAHYWGSYRIGAATIIDIGESSFLTAVPSTGPVGIGLTWSAIANAESYRIYRTTTGQDQNAPDYNGFSLLTEIPSPGTTFYRDGSVEIDTTYYYYIEGTAGNYRGSPSLIASASVQVPLETINTLNVTAAPSAISLLLDWQSVENAAGYGIYRTESPQDMQNPDYSSFSLLTRVEGPETVSYEDSTIEPEKSYYYYVSAYFHTKEAAPGGITEGLFTWTDYKPASALIEASEGYSQRIRIHLEEKLETAGIMEYEIFRSEVNGNYDNLVKVGSFTAENQTGDFIEDGEVLADGSTYYYYCVRVILSNGGNNLYSNYSYYDSGVASP